MGEGMRLFFVIFILLSGVTAEATSLRLDLRSTIQYAVEHSPSLEVLRRDLSISEMQKSNAFSQFLPQLDLSSNYSMSDRNPQLTTPAQRYGSDFGLYLTENIYDNGISLLNYGSAKINRQIAELNYEKERDKLVLDVASQFLDYSLAVRLHEVQKTQFEIIQKQFNSIAALYQQGIKTRRDYLRFKSELRRSEIQLQNTKTRVETTQADLIKLLLPTEELLKTTFEFTAEPVQTDLAETVPTEKPNVENHWIFRMAKMRSGVFENDVSIARRSYYPQFFLSAGASYGSQQYWKTGSTWNDNDFTSWNALLKVNFNLWDWGLRRRNVTIAQDRKIQKEKSLEMEMNEFIANNEKLMLSISLSHNNFLTAKELLSIETDAYAFLQGEYRNGRVSYLDLILGLRDLLNAKNQLFNSFFDLRTQLLQYKYHQGKLYENFK